MSKLRCDRCAFLIVDIPAAAVAVMVPGGERQDYLLCSECANQVMTLLDDWSLVPAEPWPTG